MNCHHASGSAPSGPSSVGNVRLFSENVTGGMATTPPSLPLRASKYTMKLDCSSVELVTAPGVSACMVPGPAAGDTAAYMKRRGASPPPATAGIVTDAPCESAALNPDCSVNGRASRGVR